MYNNFHFNNSLVSIPEKPKRAPRRKIWARHASAERDRLYNQDNRCFWCGKITFMGKGNGCDLATIDHVKSWPECESLAEWANPSNMVLACISCNQRRSHEYGLKTMAPKKWAAYLEKQKQTGDSPLISP